MPNMELNNIVSGIPLFLPNILAKRQSRFDIPPPCPAKKARVEGRTDKGAESLFVRNLPFDTTAEDLKSLFTDANDISLPLFKNGKNRGKSRGFAFITFQTVELAETWLQQTQGAQIHGRTITVGLATGPTKTLIVNGLCEKTTDKTLMDSFGGAIGAKIVTDEETGSSKGVGFVDFDNEQACQAAKESMKDAEIDGNRVTLSYGTRRGPTKTLYVTGLCEATTDKSLMDAFEGAIGAKRVTDKETGFFKGFGFVIFDNRRACQAAQEAMNGGMVDGNRVTVHYEKPKGF